MMNDKLEIKARLGDDGLFYASSLHAEDGLGYEIEGPLGSISDVSISVLGVEFMIDMNTMFENGVPASEDYVEVEDDDGDGVADYVEIED